MTDADAALASQLEAMKRRRRELRELREAEEAQILRNLRDINGRRAASEMAMAAAAATRNAAGDSPRAASRASEASLPAGSDARDFNARRRERLRAREPQIRSDLQALQQRRQILEQQRLALNRRLEELASGEKARVAELADRIDRRQAAANDSARGLRRQLDRAARQEERADDLDRANRAVQEALAGAELSRQPSTSYHAESILNEISSLRQFYIANGGGDAQTLKRMTDMMNEALELERIKNDRQPWRRQKEEAHKRRQAALLDAENRRLYEDLQALQERNREVMRAFANAEAADAAAAAATARSVGLGGVAAAPPPFIQQPAAAPALTPRQLPEFQPWRQTQLPIGRRSNNGERQMAPRSTRSTGSEMGERAGPAAAAAAASAAPKALSGPPAGKPETADPPLPLLDEPVYKDVKFYQPVVQPPPELRQDPLAPTFYDPSLGFILYMDFITGLDVHVNAVRLILSLHAGNQELGEPAVHPLVRTEDIRGEAVDSGVTHALLAHKQPVPRASPLPGMGAVLELQCRETSSRHLFSRAWTRLSLFDNERRLVSGRFKLPLRILPIKPDAGAAQLNSVPQWGNAILHVRVANARDGPAQDAFIPQPSNTNLYAFPTAHGRQAGNARTLLLAEAAPGTTGVGVGQRAGGAGGGLTGAAAAIAAAAPEAPSPPVSQRSTPTAERDDKSEDNEEELDAELEELQDTDDLTRAERILGFQVDRVKHAEPGVAKLRLSAYYASDGQVVSASNAPVTASTSAVRSNFKSAYHVFGQQEATFYDVDFAVDMVLIARFYLQPQETVVRSKLESGAGASAAEDFDPDNPLTVKPPTVTLSDDNVVAWAAMPLVVPRVNRTAMHGRYANARNDLRLVRVNKGTHELPLFEPPVIDPQRVAFEHGWTPVGYRRYGRATVRLHIFHPYQRARSLTPSDDSDEGQEDEPPPLSWIPLERRRPPLDPFHASDGFDLYMDGCRFLPDTVTITKIRARLLTRRYVAIGNEISCMAGLDSDIYNPDFDHRHEVREPDLPPSATLLMKLYTIDRFSKKLVLIGFSALNIFLDIGTERQPQTDATGVQVALNEGCHQLRIYREGPSGKEPLTEDLMRRRRLRPVMGATVLVRLFKAPVGHDGKPLSQQQVPEYDWRRLGLQHQKPYYSDRVYYSLTCKPSIGESKILHAHMRRPKTTVREIMSEIAGRKLETVKESELFVANILTKQFDSKYAALNVNYLSQYVPHHGIKLIVDGCINLPWHNFTLAHFCLNPPGAFYLGRPHAAYDKPAFTGNLDLTSTNKSPIFNMDWHHFRNRTYHRNMTVIIHLQEIAVTSNRQGYQYSLLDQAWTAMQVFENGFVYTDTYQLPLFVGSPSQGLLQQLTRMRLVDFMQAGVSQGYLNLINGASVLVKLCDGRREEELTAVTDDELIVINQDFIPENLQANYKREVQGTMLKDMIPAGKPVDTFVEMMVKKFKSLIYNLYEADAYDQ